MKRYGVDSAHSWFLVAAGTLVVLSSGGSFLGSAGVLYTAYMDVHQVAKQEASWPSSVHAGMAILAGPIAAVLNTRFSIRSTTTFGVLLSVVGLSACFFTSNIIFLCIFYGVVSGLGDFIINILMPALMTRVFKKQRVAATGCVLTGIPLGTLIYPLITQGLLNSYGLNGTFLMLGAITAHGLLGSTLLVEPERKQRVLTICNETTSHKEAIEKMESSFPPFSPDCIVSSNGDIRGIAVTPVSLTHKTNFESEEAMYCSQCNKDIPENYPVSLSNEDDKTEAQLKENKNKLTIQFVRILTVRGFHLSNLAQCVSYFMNFLYMLVIIDYATEKNIVHLKALSLVPIHSTGMLLGRFFLGWIVDKDLVPKTVYMCIAYGTLGFLCYALPFVFRYELLIMISVVYGALLGNLIPTANVLFADYLPQEDVVMSMSISRSCVGVLSLLRSIIIGTFCGGNGSYNPMFIFLGSLAAGTSLMMLTEFAWSKRTRKVTVTSNVVNT